MNKAMNINTYGAYYGKFHECSVSHVQDNIITFDFENSEYETWMVSRMYPAEHVSIDCDKPLLLALKAFYKSDVPASVICNPKYLWTVCLGKERLIYPISKEMNAKHRVHLYATPYFVTNPKIVADYLQSTIRPAYENVFFYKNTVLYLDNQDLPYPGGCYFDKVEPTPYYRICFLSDEGIDYVSKLAKEWQARRNVLTIPYMSRDVKALPKFINFKPVGDIVLSESNMQITGIIHKTLSSKKPELLIQDILNSYYKSVVRRSTDQVLDLSHLGLIIEWPFMLTFEGARLSEKSEQAFVALSINGNNPSYVLHVSQPYDRFVVYNHVPATLWTPISFVMSTLLTDTSIRKVVLDTVVVGLVYQKMFFCLSQPLLEGVPTKHSVLNGKYLLSTASLQMLKEDSRVRIGEIIRYNEKYSLCRVVLPNTPYHTWCLTQAEDTHPFPKNIQLPGLVEQWLSFFMEVGETSFDVDVSAVRLAMTLSKHNICFNLNAVDHTKETITLSDNAVNFYLNEKVVQFINDARLAKEEGVDTKTNCTIS